MREGQGRQSGMGRGGRADGVGLTPALGKTFSDVNGTGGGKEVREGQADRVGWREGAGLREGSRRRGMSN